VVFIFKFYWRLGDDFQETFDNKKAPLFREAIYR
jgi:hypothetical protein